ncbi:GM11087 [Drosophila sechellia]|uniref:GM11087 n=1 Tax=Drosophila sechellia TaxID=7238 RepID=B4HX40_DROSE|nr:GM11087 [Drosophila sechellia]
MRKKLKLRQPQPLSHWKHWNHCNHCNYCTTEAATASAQLEIFKKMIFMATLTELPELRPPIDSFAVLLAGIECRTRSDHHRRATMAITH